MPRTANTQMSKPAPVPVAATSAIKATSHTVLAPPRHPPYEAHIDLRIPLHFSCPARDLWNHRKCATTDYAQSVCDEAIAYMESKGFDASLMLLRTAVVDPYARPDDDDDPADGDPCWSPMFWGVMVEREDIGKWRQVHEMLLQVIREAYSDLAEFATDPPIRYFIDWGGECW